MAKFGNSQPPHYLSVLDASTVEDFVKKARKVWREGHPEAKKKRGRPDEFRVVCDGLTTLLDEGVLQKRKFNVYNLKKAWWEEFPESNLSKDTVDRWAKFWFESGRLHMVLRDDFLPVMDHMFKLLDNGKRDELLQYIEEIKLPQKMGQLNKKVQSPPWENPFYSAPSLTE